MPEEKAGVVLVSQFVASSSEQYSEYISYMDRPEAVRTENFFRYDAFTAKYMDNPDKTISKSELKKHQIGTGNPERSSALFTSTKNILSAEDKQNLKEKFRQAQDAGSPMWQNVISFDNSFLEELGVYNSSLHSLDETMLKEATRKAMQQNMKAEGLDGTAVWSASIHFNTDNIHVHIAMVEPKPTREKGLYRNIKKIKWKNGKPKDVKPKEVFLAARRALYAQLGKPDSVCEGKASVQLDFKGKSFSAEIDYRVSEQYRAKFKPKTLEKMKSEISSTLLDRSQEYAKINDLIRKNLVGHKREHPSCSDPQMKDRFFTIYRKLPADRLHWQYGYHTIAHLRPEIDAFSKEYITRYCTREYSELLTYLDQEVVRAERTFGKGKSHQAEYYKQQKLADLYRRMGNTLLTEMRNFDKEMRGQNKKQSKAYSGKMASRQKLIRKKKSARHFSRSWLAIKQAMKKDVQHIKNQTVYQTIVKDMNQRSEYE